MKKGPDYVQSSAKPGFDLAFANAMFPVRQYVRLLITKHLREERGTDGELPPLIAHE